MVRCEWCGAPKWWSDSNWNVTPDGEGKNHLCAGCFKEWPKHSGVEELVDSPGFEPGVM